MARSICKRCLLAELDDLSIYESVQKYIGTIPANDRTNSQEYASRLDRCRACEHLLDGVCHQCGCYVEMRAASRSQRCPKKMW